MKRKIISFALILMLVLSLVNVVFADTTVSVILDGKTLDFDVPPQIINGRTMVPIRVIFEAMGAKVNWYEPIKSARAEKDNKFVTVKLESKNLRIMPFGQSEEQIIEMDCVPMLIDGRILVPARYVAEAFNYNVNWDEAKKTVVISSGKTTDENNTQNNSIYPNVDGYDFLDNLYYNKGPFNLIDDKKNNLYIEKFVVDSIEKNKDNTFLIICDIAGTLYSTNSFSYYAFYIDENWNTIGKSLLNVVGEGQFKKIDFLFDCPPQTRRIYLAVKDPELNKINSQKELKNISYYKNYKDVPDFGSCTDSVLITDNSSGYAYYYISDAMTNEAIRKYKDILNNLGYKELRDGYFIKDSRTVLIHIGNTGMGKMIFIFIDTLK